MTDYPPTACPTPDRRPRLPQLLCLLVLATAASATADLDLSAYQRHLDENAGVTAAQLLERHGSDRFAASATTAFGEAAFADSIDHYYQLTPYEELLLDRYSFAVTERLRPQSFGAAFLEIYKRDLPLFVSSDAILHALHMSYDAVLVDLESTYLITCLDRALGRMHRALPAIPAPVDDVPDMSPMLEDVDVYLTVARRLLGSDAPALHPDLEPVVDEILALVAAQRPASYPLFGQAGREIDFSQFTVRGHYTRDESLSRYFQAMIWLGRTELYMESPTGPGFPALDETIVQRQTVDALILDDLARVSGAAADLDEMERLLAAFVGEQDNLTREQLHLARQAAGIDHAGDALDLLGFRRLQTEVRAAAAQHILSQILLRDPLGSGQVQPAPAFLLLGQRFVIDSYITANVVYDKIQHAGQPVFRGLPSSLDVLFALGNDTAIQFLGDELERYHYAPNLAALRFLIDNQDEEFWGSSLYAGWLQAIRALSPPSDRATLPAFMQTNAWWQQKMNTQLASWAQLRHDNLLYAKQSYTAGIVCEYPETYIEPEPDLYRAVGVFARHAASTFGEDSPMSDGMERRYRAYFGEMAAIADTLASVADKEIAGIPVSADERLFLQTVLYEEPVGCAPVFRGWYSRLYYRGEDDLFEPDMVVADVHTQPTDEGGAPVGHVMHVGTGPLNQAVVVAGLPHRSDQVAFVGPVMSYYEHVTLGFDRLTDEEWRTVHAQPPSSRPAFANLYLASQEGSFPGEAMSLATAVATPPAPFEDLPQGANLTSLSHPNPFNATTLIRFRIGGDVAPGPAVLSVHNAAGQAVRELLRRDLAPGSYSVRWDGRDATGAEVASGQYYYVLRLGSQETAGKMSLIR